MSSCGIYDGWVAALFGTIGQRFSPTHVVNGPSYNVIKTAVTGGFGRLEMMAMKLFCVWKDC